MNNMFLNFFLIIFIIICVIMGVIINYEINNKEDIKTLSHSKQEFDKITPYRHKHEIEPEKTKIITTQSCFDQIKPYILSEHNGNFLLPTTDLSEEVKSQIDKVWNSRKKRLKIEKGEIVLQISKIKSEMGGIEESEYKKMYSRYFEGVESLQKDSEKQLNRSIEKNKKTDETSLFPLYEIPSSEG
ncbi:MAG: hypothetical protein ACQBVK_04185 [Candidatus Phytoplasma sp. TWB_XP]